jgi:hypothetical protein
MMAFPMGHSKTMLASPSHATTMCRNLGYPTVPLSSRFVLVLMSILSLGRGGGRSTGRGSGSGVGLRW